MLKRFITASLLCVLLTAVCAAQNTAERDNRADPAAVGPAYTNIPATPQQQPQQPLTRTSEIEAITPPWETGQVQWPQQWPSQAADYMRPDLADPWIPGIEWRRPVNQPSNPAPAADQAPRTVVIFVPVAVPVEFLTSPVTLPSPVQRELKVTVVPRLPGPGDDAALYRLQVGAFKTRQNAQAVHTRLSAAGFRPDFEEWDGLTRVLLPGIRGREIREIDERLYNAGIREIWLRKEQPR
jgi:cell division protein FtsN